MFTTLRCHLALAVVLLYSTAAAGQTNRPNILFLFADDQRADTIRALGNSQIRTPSLDRLAARGTVMDRAYCMGSNSGAVCAPSRAMVMSGRSLWRLPQKRMFNLPDTVELWPQRLRRAGYTTFATGKWHNGYQSFARAFDDGGSIFFGGMGSHTELRVHDFAADGKYDRRTSRPIHDFSSTAFADEAVRFLVERDRTQPFFLYVAFTAPHDPRTPPLADRYDANPIPLPANYLSRHPFENGELVVRDEKLGPWPRSPSLVRRDVADYYGMITQMDRQIGRVLDTLEQTGEARRTIVVFAADHGLAVGSHGLLGKQNLYEHSMRVPMIIAGPGVPEGERRRGLTYLFDLEPTVTNLIGLPRPAGLDGHDQTPVLRGEKSTTRDHLYTAYRNIQRSVRDDRWKLVTYPRNGHTQLFDLANDPHEMNDLSDHAKHDETRRSLTAKLAEISLENGDPVARQAPPSMAKHRPLPPNRPKGKAAWRRLRGGLRNSRIAFKQKRQGTVAFLGGSITKMSGWRDLVEDDLRRRYPETTFEFRNAGLPSTGSIPGAFRLVRDVFRGGVPDLLFVEFAVNDSTNGRTSEEIVRGMEGLVRHAQRLNPMIDIVLIHFADPEKVALIADGGTPEVISCHEMVAAHYELPSLDLAREVADRIAAGEFTWKDDFRNLHPSPFGHRVYAKAVARLFDKAWVDPMIAGETQVVRRNRPDRLDVNCFEHGHMLDIAAITDPGDFHLVTSWRPRDGTATREGFVGVPMLVADRPGATMTLPSSPNLLVRGLVVTAGPDAGVIEYRVGDDGSWRRIDLFTRWSGRLHIPWCYLFDDDGRIDDGATVTLRVGKTKNLKSRGHAVRIVALAAEGGDEKSSTSTSTFTKKTKVTATTTTRPERPDVVVILADDLGWGDPGCYNPNSRIPTPAIDRLAAQGMRFTDAHSPSAVCTPTRYGLLTGRYAWRSRLKKGVLGGSSRLLVDPNRSTIASVLGDAGYRTAAVGKWHLGLGDRQTTDYAKPLRPGPLDVGFDEFFGIPASLDMEPYVYVRGDTVEAPPSGRIAKSGHRRKNGGGFWRAGRIAPGFNHADVLPRTITEATRFIDRAVTTPRPYFLYLPLSAPHTPWLPNARALGRSGAGLYGDFVAQVDDALARIMEAVDRTGRDTLVVFTSDNGAHWPASDRPAAHADSLFFDHRANGTWRGQKADIHEGGHRVPFIVRRLGHVAPNTTSEALVGLHDIFATVTDLIDVPSPDAAAPDSVSFRSVLEERRKTSRDEIVHHSLNGMFALRLGRWKLIEARGSGGFTSPTRIKPKPGEPEGQLYDLRTDPRERNNLWTKRPEVVARLTARLDELRTD